jgi:hypothetical protein
MSSPRVALFACAKTLDGGHIETIQRNAITSWTLLPETPEILLFGDASVERLAAELGVRYGAEVVSTAGGAPRVDELFKAAERLAEGELLAYVNADVILLPDFISAVTRMTRRPRPFLVVGQRTDLDVDGPVDFVNGWDGALRQRSAEEGVLHGPKGIDYFVYRRGFWGDAVPPFALGRTAWDCWLLHHARSTRSALVDATAVVTAVHQNHDYSHVAGGSSEVWSGEEAVRNFELAGGPPNLRFIDDATHVLTPKRLLPAVTRPYLSRRWERFLLFNRLGQRVEWLGAVIQRRLRRPAEAAR